MGENWIKLPLPIIGCFSSTIFSTIQVLERLLMDIWKPTLKAELVIANGHKILAFSSYLNRRVRVPPALSSKRRANLMQIDGILTAITTIGGQQKVVSKSWILTKSTLSKVSKHIKLTCYRRPHLINSSSLRRLCFQPVNGEAFRNKRHTAVA